MRKPFRDLLESGRKPIGAYMMYHCDEVVEIMKLAGLDFVILDYEHGCLDSKGVMSMIRTADSVGMAAMIRVPEVNESAIKRALDMGASALKVPGIASAEQARKVVEFAKFPPDGKRGACPHVRFNDYGVGDRTDCYRKSNAETVITIAIESPEGLADMEEIIKVPGIDVVHTGFVDLALMLGLPGQVHHPKVQQAAVDIANLCEKHGKTSCIFIFNPEEAAAYKDVKGVSHFHVHVPHQMLYEGYKELVDAVKRW